MFFRPSELAKAIVCLLEDDPKGWECDRFNLKHHKAQISIWIANSAYGLCLDRMSLKDHNIPTLSGTDRRFIWSRAKEFKPKKTKGKEMIARINCVLLQKYSSEELQ